MPKDREYLSRLRKLVEKLGLQEKVFFVGALAYENLPQRLARASVFVRPSRSEGMGVAFLDAMAAGVPIIGTRVGGIPDFLKDHETGLFCTVDDPQSVAAAITEILDNEDVRNRIISNASQLVRERYDWNTIVPQYKLLFESIT